MSEPSVVLRPEILAEVAYQQGKPAAPGDRKLSSNELPFPPLPSVVAAIRDAADYHRYPDATAATLREALGDRYGVDPAGVLIGAGSVALLYQAALAAASTGDEIVYPWRSFEAYPSIVTLTGATGVPVPLRADGTTDLTAIEDAITNRTRLVLLCTPNNPTGTTLGHDELLGFLSRVRDDLLVIVDEAYVEFVTDRRAADASKLLAGHPNVVLARTFSKAYGLASLRVGYLIGEPAVLAALRPAGIPLSVTAQAVAGALAALDEGEETARRVAEITVRRDELRRAMLDQGWPIPASQANFLWLPTLERTGEADEVLRAHGIIARPFAGDGIRISIGDDGSVSPILAATSAILERYPYLRADQRDHGDEA